VRRLQRFAEAGVRKRKTLNSQCIKQIGICEKDKFNSKAFERGAAERKLGALK
jgi:hypothetical protein